MSILTRIPDGFSLIHCTTLIAYPHISAKSLHSRMSTASSTVSSVQTTVETRNRAASPAPVGVVGSGTRGTHDTIKRVLNCIKEISESGIGSVDFDKIIQERSHAINELRAANIKLEDMTREVDELNRFQKRSLENFVAETEDWKTKWNEEKAKLIEAQSLEMRKASAQLNASHTQNASLNRDLVGVSEKTQMIKSQLETAHQELAQWRSPVMCLRKLDVADL